MLHHLSGFDFSNLTLLVGVLVSSGIRRISNVNPGGLLASAFLILAAITSVWWAAVIPLAGIGIALAYKRFFSHIYLGRQPLFIMALMSVMLMTAVGSIMQHYRLIPPSDFNYPLGIILPAILASTISKQGIRQTMGYMLLSTAVTVAGVSAVYLIGQAAGHDFHALDRLTAQRELLHLGWGALLSLISIVIGFAAYKAWRIKSAGYIMLPFLATLCVVSPWNFVLVLGLALLVYGITNLMRRFSLLVGIGRYTFVFTVTVPLVWTAEYLLLHHSPRFSPFMGTSIFAALAIAVLVNEHSIFGIRRATPVLAASLATMLSVELAGAYAVQTLSHHSTTIRSLAVHSRHTPTIPQELGGR